MVQPRSSSSLVKLVNSKLELVGPAKGIMKILGPVTFIILGFPHLRTVNYFVNCNTIALVDNL